MKHAFLYSLKVWITAALVTPMLAYLFWSVFNTLFARDLVLNYNTFAGAFLDGSQNTSVLRIATVNLDIFQSTLYSIPYLLVIFLVAMSLSKQ